MSSHGASTAAWLRAVGHGTWQFGSSLTTPVGTMKGSYQMVAEDGTHFDAEIPEFVLAIPRALH